MTGYPGRVTTHGDRDDVDRASRDEARRLLGIYLRDHHAAALGGVTLARRRCTAATGTAVGDTLSHIVGEIEEDREVLRTVLERHGMKPSRWRDFAVRAAAEAGRLKPNGHLVRRSPLSDVFELEALIGGIEVKRRLCETLGATFGSEATAAGDWTYRGLSVRAESQRERLMPHHRESARAAFGAIANGSAALEAGSIIGADR